MRYMLCQCECGNTKEVSLQNLRSGQVRSCGCRAGKLAHGHAAAQSPTYLTWVAMRARCHNKNHSAYPRYGGRGVAVCDSWRNCFANFLKDMGERPEGATLDRLDNAKGYEPSNCRWATTQEQYLNKTVKRNKRGQFST